MEAEVEAEGVEEVALVQHQPQQLPGKPGELLLWHRSLPLPLALDFDGGDDGDDLQPGVGEEEEVEVQAVCRC